MPSLKSAKSALWFCRIDGDEDILRPKVSEFANKIDCVNMLVAHHKGGSKENPHCHCVITMAGEVQKQTFALRIKKHFEVVDRGYALDVWDGRRAEYGAVSYLFHEEDAPLLCSKGWSQEEIQAAQFIAQQTNVAVNEAKQKASFKLVERAIEHFQLTNPSRMEIFRFMMYEIHGGRAHHPGIFKLKQYVEEVEIKMTGNINTLIINMFQDIWRN